MATTKQMTTVSDDNDEEQNRIRALISWEMIRLITSAEQRAEAGAIPASTKLKKKREDLCKPGDVVGQRFRVLVKLCEGGYGQIYKGRDERTQVSVALKVERLTTSNDNNESHVLRQFHDKSYHCPKMYAAGRSQSYTFVAMQLLGKNVSELRRMCSLKPSRLSFSACIRVTLQCLEAVESLHYLGYVHRDIKPSNFAIGGEPRDRHVIYMLDYGLCRNYIRKDGTLKAAREKVGFRGTVRYASLTAHRLQELSRRDDLISLYYSFYELMLGHLPWHRTNEREIVAQMKTQHTLVVLATVLPKHVKAFAQHVDDLRYESKPDYGYLGQCLRQLLKDIDVKVDAPYDWQLKDCKDLYHYHSV